MGRTRAVLVSLTVAAFTGGGLLAAPGPSADPAVLMKARENLRISQLTLHRIERELEVLRRRPQIDPSVLADYSIYLLRVRSLTEAHGKVVEAMEAVNPQVPPVAPAASWPQVEPFPFDPAIPEPIDELSRLQREFVASLEAFDTFLLEEQYKAQRAMEDLADASSQEMTDLAREAAAAVERLRAKGIEVETGSPSDGANGGSQGAAGETPGSPGAPGAPGDATGEPGSPEQHPNGRPGEPAAEGASTRPAQDEPGEGPTHSGNAGDAGDTTTGSGGGASGSGDPSGSPASGVSGPAPDDGSGPTPPETRPPADDDDIVARQLREAAEKETDPELKKKLWQEYDRYKGLS